MSPRFPRWLTLGVLLAAFAGTVPAEVASEAGEHPWAAYMRDPQHTARAQAIGPALPLLVSRPLNFGYSSPVVANDGTIYIASTIDQAIGAPAKLFALNPDLSEKWSTAIPYTDHAVPAVGPEGHVYIGTDVGLFAFDSSGLPLWAVGGASFRGSSATIGLDATVYIGSFAFRPDGTPKYAPAIGMAGSPALAQDGTVYVGNKDGGLYAFNGDGSLRWHGPTGPISDFGGPSVGPDGTIYLASRDYHLYAFSHEGALKWKLLLDGTPFGTPAIGQDGRVYVGTAYGRLAAFPGDQKLYAVDPDGGLAWTFQATGMLWGSPAIDGDGTIYFTTAAGSAFGGNLHAVTAAGQLKWSVFIGRGESSPAIGADGVIYVGAFRSINAIHNLLPVTTIHVSPPANANGWHNGDTEIQLHATATAPATVANISYSLAGAQSGSDVVPGDTASIVVTEEGTTTVTYHAVDSLGHVESDQVFTLQIDRTPPVIVSIPDQTIVPDSPVGGSFVFTPTATDTGGSGVVSVTATPPGPFFPIGDTVVTMTALDAAGNGALPVTFTVTVGDITPPTITHASAGTALLWPANHKMVPITITATATDDQDPSPECRITSITSNEPVDGLGDGDTAPDWLITGALTATLRAERSGHGSGRDYTIGITCADASGNSATTSVHVMVPRDQRK